jgi:predicted unusual protein kinase regulating ubiquinone biosynthesis (AarF/ABC1/UbiB family)
MQSAAADRPRSVVPDFRPRERFVRVSSFFLGVIAHIYILDVFFARFALTRWYVRRTQMQRWVSLARRFRYLALQLGGMQIKLGQFLSARADVVPEPVRRELAGLQDEVPAAPAEHVLDVIISELGAAPQSLFREFDAQAVAAASLGQVHYATLENGREVAVKVQRPFIEQIIEVDLSALTWVVRLIKNYPPIKRRADLEALLDEFGRVLLQELDYEQEARHAETFRANFAADPGVYAPEPIRELTTRRVLVMERISGYKITDFATLEALGVRRQEVAARLNNSYLKQFFVDGFFHADPHAGNLFIRVEAQLPVLSRNGYEKVSAPMLTDEDQTTAATGTPFTLIYVDFGMTGRLTAQMMEKVQSAVIGLATNSAERIVQGLDDLNMILPNADRRQIVQGIDIMLRHTYNRTMAEINSLDVDAIFAETRDMVYDLPFQIPQDLLYMGRAMSMCAGLSTAIDPNINLFASLRPFARRLIEREDTNVSWSERMQREVRDLGQILVNLPRHMDLYYRTANRGELQTRSDITRLERGMKRVEKATERLAGGIIATGLFLGGVQLRTRGLPKEASRAWWVAGAAILWSFWPRGER